MSHFIWIFEVLRSTKTVAGAEAINAPLQQFILTFVLPTKLNYFGTTMLYYQDQVATKRFDVEECLSKLSEQ